MSAKTGENVKKGLTNFIEETLRDKSGDIPIKDIFLTFLLNIH